MNIQEKAYCIKKKNLNSKYPYRKLTIMYCMFTLSEIFQDMFTPSKLCFQVSLLLKTDVKIPLLYSVCPV